MATYSPAAFSGWPSREYSSARRMRTFMSEGSTSAIRRSTSPASRSLLRLMYSSMTTPKVCLASATSPCLA